MPVQPKSSKSIPMPVSVSSPAIPEPIDRINNISQKESAMSKAGVTRYKYLKIISDAMDAVKIGDIFHPNGDVTRGEVPDVQRRQWGAEQAAKLHGDMIERKEIEHDIGDKTLEKMKSLSVAELRERAKAILQGKPIKRIDIEANEINGS